MGWQFGFILKKLRACEMGIQNIIVINYFYVFLTETANI
jgi:hypothetical protein